MNKNTMTRVKDEDIKTLRIIKAEQNFKTIAEAISFLIKVYNEKK